MERNWLVTVRDFKHHSLTATRPLHALSYTLYLQVELFHALPYTLHLRLDLFHDLSHTLYLKVDLLNALSFRRGIQLS